MFAADGSSTEPAMVSWGYAQTPGEDGATVTAPVVFLPFCRLGHLATGNALAGLDVAVNKGKARWGR